MPSIITRGAMSAAAFGFTSTRVGRGYWIATLGGSTGDIGRSIAIDGSGNVYVAGYTTSQGAGNSDILITKYNTSGVIQWQRTLGGTLNDYGYGIVVDSSGNAYVAGATLSQGAGSSDILITKYDTSGAIQWQRILGGTRDDAGYAIALDSSANVYVAGYTGAGAANDDLLVTKYNSSGTIQWQRTLGGSVNDYGYGIALDSSANVYVAGYTRSQGAGSADMLITKYNTSGTIQWQRILGGTGAEVGYCVAVDSSGNVYAAGSTTPVSTSAIMITKYNTSGTIQWQRTLTGSVNALAYGIALDSSANVYIVGQALSPVDVIIAKYNTSGTIQWQRTLSGTLNDLGYGIVLDNSGNMYIAGQTTSTGAGSNDVLIAKLPSDGSLTGTYGPWTYAASSLTDAASTFTAATSTLTAAPSTLTAATSTLTDAASTLTRTVTQV